jgi:hypothetical protein
VDRHGRNYDVAQVESDPFAGMVALELARHPRRFRLDGKVPIMTLVSNR